MKVIPIMFLAFSVPLVNGQYLHCPSGAATLGFVRTVELPITDSGGGHLKFKYARAESNNGTLVPDEFNFTVLIPPSGTTPASVSVGTNPFVLAQLKPGAKTSINLLFTTVDQIPASTVACGIDLIVPAEPPPGIQAAVNAASLQPFLSPGAQVSILGSHLTGPTLSTTYGPTASYPTSVASTSVTFDGIAAPLLYVSPSQINAIVPFGLAGQTSAQVVVQRFDQASAAFTVPLQDTSPGIFTAGQSGTGQGVILQQGSAGQFTYNTCDNRAASGTTVELFVTGAGVWTPPAQSDVLLFGRAFITQPVSVTIGGQPAKVLYAGTSGTLSTWSLLQVNAVVPDRVSSGPQPVVLTIGANDNSQQKVTVCIQ